MPPSSNGLELDGARDLVASAQRAYIRDRNDLSGTPSQGHTGGGRNISYSSDYFIATLRVTIDGAQARGVALFARAERRRLAHHRLAQSAVSLLRIYASLLDPPQRCQWALVNGGREPVLGEGRLAELPRRAERVQLVIPAAQVLITRARVPQGARRRAGSVLAFAVEEKTAGEPDANQVSWLGVVGDEDALAVADKEGLERWRQALGAVGIRAYEVHCETLFLPWRTGEWSLAWNGNDGFVRTGEFEGTATDCGDRQAPPLSLRLILEEVAVAQRRSIVYRDPSNIA